jgi:hypothetical protein
MMLSDYRLVQARVTSILLEAALKEYTADWLKNADSVVRDETGKFAKKAASVGQEVSQVKQSVEEAIKNPKEAKQKVSRELLKLTSKGLDKSIERDPKFANILVNKMFGIDAENARTNLAELYSQVAPALAQEIKLDPYQQLKKDLKNRELTKEDLLSAFEYTGTQYNQLLDNLNNLEDQPGYIQALGKVTAASIPVAAYLATTLTPEVAIGLLLEESLGSVLTSIALTHAGSAVAGKVMDEMEVDDPATRFAVDLAIGLAASPATAVLGKTPKAIAAVNSTKGVHSDLVKVASAHLSAAKGEIGKALEVNSEGGATYLAGLILKTPASKLLRVKSIYRQGFKKSAQEAQELASDLYVPNVVKGAPKRGVPAQPAEQVTFVTGGFAADEGAAGTGWVEQLENKDDLFKNHHFVNFNNADFEIPSSLRKGNVFENPDLSVKGHKVLSIVDAEQAKTMLGNILTKGKNPSAVKMAAHVYAYAQKHPDLTYNLVGHSAGGMITHETAAILKEMGINVKVANFGSPWWGMTPKVGESLTFTSKFDPAMARTPIRDKFDVDSVTDHYQYFKDKNVRERLKDFFDGKPIEPVKLSKEEADKAMAVSKRKADALNKRKQKAA